MLLTLIAKSFSFSPKLWFFNFIKLLHCSNVLPVTQLVNQNPVSEKTQKLVQNQGTLLRLLSLPFRVWSSSDIELVPVPLGEQFKNSATI